MARKRYGLNETRIARFIHEGRGSGTGKYYKPFWKVSDVPSHGRVHRVYCPLTEREHHFLSDNEYYAFLLQLWDNSVIDIREQFPLLDRRETLEIAARCGISHPVDRHSGCLLVNTTDLLVTRRTPQGTEEIAYAVKDAEAVADKRTLEKLEIERRYWERREVPWYLLTDREVKSTFTQDLAWILDLHNLRRHETHYFNRDIALIRYELALEQSRHPLMPIRLLCKLVDQKLGYELATTLGVLRQLLGAKIICVDLHARHIQDLPAIRFSFQGGAGCKSIPKS
jgi:hypothetical protein